MTEQYLRIGLAVRPHGVDGSLKLLPLTFDNGRFNGLSRAFLEVGGEYSPINIRSAKVSETSVIIGLEGVTDRDAANALRGAYICVKRSDAAKLPEGQYFIVDLIGCAVSDTEGNSYGELTEVHETGANDVYEIRGEQKLMIPALKKLLNTVDVENKRIVLDASVLAEVGLFEGGDE